MAVGPKHLVIHMFCHLDYERISSNHGRIGEHQERQPAFRPTEGSRNGHNGANEMGDAQSQQASMPPSSASAAVLHSMPVSVPSSQPASLAQPSALAVAEATASFLERMTPAQPPAAVHYHPAPVASTSSGRGRDRTMPAWSIKLIHHLDPLRRQQLHSQHPTVEEEV
mmetsp:Transcript_11428/g.20746  ORF Transcript_11428/g.20746 Transcript_11428/m.20746 type:complete len:168 (+) Transcript_11428:525-1028(+)